MQLMCHVSALVDRLVRETGVDRTNSTVFAKTRKQVAVVTNDILTQEDAERLRGEDS